MREKWTETMSKLLYVCDTAMACGMMERMMTRMYGSSGRTTAWDARLHGTPRASVTQQLPANVLLRVHEILGEPGHNE